MRCKTCLSWSIQSPFVDPPALYCIMVNPYPYVLADIVHHAKETPKRKTFYRIKTQQQLRRKAKANERRGAVCLCTAHSSSSLLWLLIYSVYNSKADDKCPAECTCAKIFINWRPPNLRRRKTNKFRCERQSCYIYMNMQVHGWDMKINLTCMCSLPIVMVLC